MGVGIGMGPNGQIGPVITFDSGGSSAPQEFASHFETPEGVAVEVTYKTTNKVLADGFEAKIAQNMGWKILEAAKDDDMSFGVELLMGWVLALVAAFLVWFLGFAGSAVAESAGYITSSRMEDLAPQMVRYAIYTFPIVGVIFNIAAIVGRRSK